MLPFAHHAITVKRPDQTADPYAGAGSDPETIATGVRAEITGKAGTFDGATGVRVMYDAKLHCDPCDVQQGDLIDVDNGDHYIVRWAQLRSAWGLDHVVGYLQRAEGHT